MRASISTVNGATHRSTRSPAPCYLVSACLIALWLWLPGAALQASDAAPANNAETVTELGQATTTAHERAELQARLLRIQSVLTQKKAELAELEQHAAAADDNTAQALQAEAANLQSAIAQLSDVLEQLVIGEADASLFAVRNETQKQDWREDIALIAQPVLDSLKEITEKPRRIKELSELVMQKEQELEASRIATQNLTAVAKNIDDEALSQSIQAMEAKWQKRTADAINAIEVAQIQIASLQGNKPLHETVYEGLLLFVHGRGLTLLLAVLAVLLVLGLVRLIMHVYRRTVVNERKSESRTRYRLAKYSMHAFTMVLILIAVFVVFYERHDVLLLGVLILLIVGFALSARHLLPRYIQEARLLLNIGAIREGERVIYNNLPWRVESLNMYSVLRNPELDGALRLPLAELTNYISRPVSNESWFPTSTGDIVLDGNESLYQVYSQNPDTVVLQSRGGELRSFPSCDFYTTAMTNLTRGGTFGVTVVFGIDYDLQALSTEYVPAHFKQHVSNTLAASNLGKHVREVRVELQQAGSSSIDYWIFVTMDSAAARSYRRIGRIVQASCIECCSVNGWSIPYPHMSVVKKAPAANDEAHPLPSAQP